MNRLRAPANSDRSSRRSWLLRPLLWLALLVASAAASPYPVAAQVVSGISAPAQEDALTGDVVIQGTAVIEPFQKYELHFKQEPSGDDAFIYFDGGTQPVVNGRLGIWRASSLPPGTYTLRLRVVKQDGNYAEYYARNLSLHQRPQEPTPTPTADQPTSDQPTPTPIPIATFTPVPQPTPNVGMVDQPPAAASPTPTEPSAVVAVAGGSSTGQAATTGAAATDSPANVITRQLGQALALERLRGEFARGARFSAAVFGLLGLVFGAKALYAWIRSRSM